MNEVFQVEKSDTLEKFKAEKPVKPWNYWVTVVVLRIVFPPILLWDLIKYAANTIAGDYVGKNYINPAIYLGNKHANYKEKQTIESAANLPVKIHKVRIETYDNAALETLEVINNNLLQSKNEDQQKYIINFVGSHDCYQNSLLYWINEALFLDCHLILFNYRGVVNSTGSSSSAEDLVVDGISQVQRLLKKGVQPQNIVLRGHSLGGGIAALVANYFHENGLSVKHFNHCSFSTLSKVRSSSLIEHAFIKLGLVLSGWEIDAEAAFKNLPNSSKEYLVVRSSKEERNSDNKIIDDLQIPHHASMHTAVKDEMLFKDSQNSNRNKFFTTDRHLNGHHCHLNALQSRVNKSSGLEFFKHFIYQESENGIRRTMEKSTHLVTTQPPPRKVPQQAKIF